MKAQSSKTKPKSQKATSSKAKTANRKAAAKKAARKSIYAFGKKTDGNAQMRALLGGKGANLAEMARIGLPVPAGCTITTEVCNFYDKTKGKYPKGFPSELKAAIASLELQNKKQFGSSNNPLLLSVRSGARDSMPGMMDTILNLGLNDKTVEALAKQSKNPRFAWDCYRRFIQMYGGVVLQVHARNEAEPDPFEELLTACKRKCKAEQDTDLKAEDLQQLVRSYKKLIQARKKKSFPQDPMEQLMGAIGAVFQSWGNDRAILYRQKYNIPHDWGTAVNIQTMVFGNLGEDSATGVAFTRDPACGEKIFYGEYLMNAQGEDVVAGTRTPEPIIKLKKVMPKPYGELDSIRKLLEKHFKDMQDFEFTIESGKLYMLQTRNGKRTGLAAVRIACEMVKERRINIEQAIKRIPAESIASLLVPVFSPTDLKKTKPLTTGLPAGPGAATGQLIFSASGAEHEAKKGKKVILCRTETSPEDLRGMIASEGILTSRGGVSSHAALVARQMGKICVCGASEMHIDYAKKTLTIGKKVLREGDTISVDGTSGHIYAGTLKPAPSEVTQVLQGKRKASQSRTYQLFSSVMQWADRYRKLKIRTNADTPQQTELALKLGAEGLGLCRTEHMFFEGRRIEHMRAMILATNPTERRAALGKLIGYQREDFKKIFKSMHGLPVTIRLLDPPLHEFLPHESASIQALAQNLGLRVSVVAARVKALHEENPMLGHRGCRLGISYPEITEVQARAIFEAAAACLKAKIKVKPEIMVPLIAFEKEFELQAECIHRVGKEVMKAKGVKIPYQVGAMLEVPRAALCAEAIAKDAEFFSFGTNDLTQTALGMSRDDAGAFLPAYQDLEILSQNPFASLERNGVGELVEIGTKRARKGRKTIKIGVCGEHGGDPHSIELFHALEFDYISCSPPRVPIARLAAAQAALKN